MFTAGSAQEHASGGPLSESPVLDAPFMADATTTVHQILNDGTQLELLAMARYYRDRAGRARVDQIVTDSGEVRTTVSDNPASHTVYTLDETTREWRASLRFLADHAVGGGDTFVVPLSGLRFYAFFRAQTWREGAPGYSSESESLGDRRIGGVEATGSRMTVTVRDPRFDHGRPIEVVDERWESSELNLLIESRYVDPRAGAIEYQLSNIRRVEPASDLFEVPAESKERVWPGTPGMRLLHANPPTGVSEVPTDIRRIGRRGV
jgi:hypothetical protein